MFHAGTQSYTEDSQRYTERFYFFLCESLCLLRVSPCYTFLLNMEEFQGLGITSADYNTSVSKIMVTGPSFSM